MHTVVDNYDIEINDADCIIKNDTVTYTLSENQLRRMCIMFISLVEVERVKNYDSGIIHLEDSLYRDNSYLYYTVDNMDYVLTDNCIKYMISDVKTDKIVGIDNINAVINNMRLSSC